MNAQVILYADSVTNSMQQAIDETNRRRELQLAYNKEHGITPETIKKAIRRGIEEELEAEKIAQEAGGAADETQYITQEYLNELEAEMLAAAEALEFERAAKLRDRILQLKKQVGQPVTPEEEAAAPPPRKKGRGRGGRSAGTGKRTPKPFGPN